tara:strand:- start:808 stop:963 length:156 start_codon:yes stop_codon:yes gene_type:complete
VKTYIKNKNKRWGPVVKGKFLEEGGAGGRGATLHSNIYNVFFYDISLLRRI